MVIVKITQADIDNGVPKQATSCPIALALRRKFPHRIVNVGYSISSAVNGGRQAWHNGARARDFIAAFDSGEQVRPKYVVLWNL